MRKNQPQLGLKSFQGLISSMTDDEDDGQDDGDRREVSLTLKVSSHYQST
jgi:hypothetical protein